MDVNLSTTMTSFIVPIEYHSPLFEMLKLLNDFNLLKIT
jgi:hypothetical protein